MAARAKVGDGSVFLSVETVYPVVFAEIFHSENSFVSRTRPWHTLVGPNVLNQRVGAGRRGPAVYHVYVKTV